MSDLEKLHRMTKEVSYLVALIGHPCFGLPFSSLDYLSSFKVNCQIRTGWLYWNGEGGGGGGGQSTRGRGLKPILCISTQRRMRFKPLPVPNLAVYLIYELHWECYICPTLMIFMGEKMAAV